MATVERLLIKGIRSFSPEHGGVITFPKPLTLIVGRNGSGKTTIIECLKHAVTGEWPPNSHSGKSFIHDPKVAGDVEVKGQIKLQCKTVLGKPFVVVRSFQLTQKKGGKYEFKALDQTISTVNEHGEREALSKRCADINMEVPSLMGVSKAILENVIFVHQDDSNWPLAEGAVLKKKFDDIFAATKYTKALEAIRKLKTDQAQGIKEKRLALETLRAHKDGAHKLRMDLADAERAHDATLKQMQELEHEIVQRQQRVDALNGTLNKIGGATQNTRVMEARRETLVAEVARRQEALQQHIDAPLEKLLEMQRKFDTSVAGKKNEQRAAERAFSDARIANEHVKDAVTRENNNQVRLAAEAEVQTARITERQTLVADIAKRHPDVGMQFAGLPTEAEVAEFGVKCHQRLRTLQQEHEELVRANAKRLQSSTDAVDKATASAVSATEGLRSIRTAQHRNEMRIAEIVAEQADAPATGRTLAEDNERLEEELAKLEKKRSDLAGARYEASIAELNKGIADMKAALSVARRERDELSSMAGVAGKVQLLQRDADEKREAAQAVYAKCTPRLQELFGDELPDADGLKARLQAFTAQQEAAGAAREAALRKQRDAVAVLTARVTDAGATLARLKEEERAKREEVVAQVLDGGPLDAFQTRMAASEAVVAEVTQKVALTSAFIKVTDNSIKHATAAHACVLCQRPFDAAGEAAFLQAQRVKEAEFPKLLADTEAHLEAAAAAVAALQRARPLWEACQRLRDVDIPKAEEALRTVTEQHAGATAKLGEAEAAGAAASARLRRAAELAGDADALERLGREAGVLSRRAEEQRAQLAHLRSGASKSLDELCEEVLEAEGRLEDEERKRDGLAAKLSRVQGELQHQERTVAAVREAVARTTARAEAAAAAGRERATLEAQNDATAAEAADLERRAAAAKAEKAAGEAARERVREENAAAEQAAGTRVRSLQRDVDAVSVRTTAIAAFVQAGKEAALARATAELAGARARLEECERGLGDLAAAVKKVEDELRNHDAHKRIVDDNVAYAQACAAAEALTAELEASAAAAEALGDVAALRRDLKRLTEEGQRFLNEQNVARGRMSTYKEQADKCRKELKDAAFKNIDEKHRHAQIELRTTEMANEDLNKYYAALDKALMAFHAAKMAEINKVVKELWQKTYRNQDIDSIYIASDAEATTGRSYNYRVVMRNGDAELDMRGRCSAGQKVLACLIIRLALAETFCLNCGILALDEPTTNLDAPNSTSLAHALTDIMQARREQESFQLIVITHDVRFAHLIGQREHAEYYWRISKDEDMHSKIEKEDILE